MGKAKPTPISTPSRNNYSGVKPLAFALVFVGLLMIVTGANNTHAQFGAQLKKDFTGEKSFLLWIAAIGGVGALGYIPALRKFSHYFMALILISIVLSNKGFFAQFVTALKNNASKTQISVRPGGSTQGAQGNDYGANVDVTGRAFTNETFGQITDLAKFGANLAMVF